jgi:hypothetical protein
MKKDEKKLPTAAAPAAKPQRKPPTIRTIGVKKGEVKNLPEPIVPKTAATLLILLLTLFGASAASPSIRSVDANVYTERLLWNLASSRDTNRIVRAATGNYYGDTNTSQFNIRTNGSGRWEWRTGATVLATNTANRQYGIWRTNGVGAAIYGYTRYEPATANPVKTDALGNVVEPSNFYRWLYSTNTSENKDVIYVTGNVSSLVNGIYRRAWTRSNSFEAVWTNTASTNLIWLNATNFPTELAFRITDKTNSDHWIGCFTQLTGHAAGSHAVNFWENPFDTTETAHFSTASPTILTWGTNFVSTNSVRFFGNDQTLLTQYGNTNQLVVSLRGDDNLANRTNGVPFKTLWAANQAALAGDVIKVENGFHTTVGIHMKRGTKIVGEGRNTILNMQYDDDVNHLTFFQSALISIWDNCTIENLCITNGCIGFTQHEGPVLGATNAVARDLWIYPAYLPNPYPEILQPSYFGVGVKFSRLGNENRCERVKVYSSGLGFSFQSSINEGLAASKFDLIDCEAICSPEFTGMTNYWLRSGAMGFGNTNVGGMIPISFSCGDSSATFNRSPITVNIIGGRYVTVNGATNAASYVGGENNISRNAAIWIARGHTNQIRINFQNMPEFVHGNTNTTSAFILNEATNNNVTISGLAQVKAVPNGDRNAAGTNTLYNSNVTLVGNYAQMIRQSAYNFAGGVSPTTFAGYTASTAFGNMTVNTTTGTISNSVAGYYKVEFTTSAAWATSPLNVALYTNGVATPLYLGGLDAISAAVQIHLSGIVYLSAPVFSDVRYQNDQPVGESIIFTMTKL